MNEDVQPQPIRPHEWLLLAAGSLLLLRYGWLMDDAFIYFRYADNALFLGRGLVYNPGEFVEGFSSPLWMLLLLALRWAGLGFWWIVRLVGLLSFALFWLAAIRVHRRLTPPGPVVWNLPLVFLALSYPVLSHFSSGLETPLIQLAAAVVALAVVEPREARWELALAPLPLLRHELLPVVLLVALLRWRANRAFPHRLLWLTLGLLGAWLGFRVLYYAALLPNTFHLKMGLNPQQGLRYVWQVLASYGLLPLLLSQLILLLWPRRDEHVTLRWKLWFLALPQLLYCILIGGDWVHYRFLAFPLPLMLLSLGGVLERATMSRRRLGAAALSVAGVGSLLLYPPQLEKPALFGISHAGEPEERLVDSIYDANAHRRQPELAHPFWEMGDAGDPLALYSAAAPLSAVLVEGWCHEAYRRWDERVVHRWGLTDPVLARIDVPAALSGHRYALRSFAEDLAAARSSDAGPVDILRSDRNPAPGWMAENESTLRAIEARMFNRHRLVDNLRLAFAAVERIRVDWGATDQPNIVLLLDPMSPDERLALLAGGRAAMPGGELRLVQSDLRRVGYECAFVGQWDLSRDDSRHRDFERWIVTRRDLDWENPTLMVERALIQYETEIDALLTELATHYIGRDHPRPFFLTLSYPYGGAGRDLSRHIDGIRRATSATGRDEDTLFLLARTQPDGTIRLLFREYGPGVSDSGATEMKGSPFDLAPTLRHAAGLRSSDAWPGQTLSAGGVSKRG